MSFSLKRKVWTNLCGSSVRQRGMKCSVVRGMSLSLRVDAFTAHCGTEGQSWYQLLCQYRRTGIVAHYYNLQQIDLGLHELKKSKFMWLAVHCLSRKYSTCLASLGLNIWDANILLLTLRADWLREIFRILAKYGFAYKYPSSSHPFFFLLLLILHHSYIYSLMPMIRLSQWVVCLFFLD